MQLTLQPLTLIQSFVWTKCNMKNSQTLYLKCTFRDWFAQFAITRWRICRKTMEESWGGPSNYQSDKDAAWAAPRPHPHLFTPPPLTNTLMSVASDKHKHWHIPLLPISPSGPRGVGHHCLSEAFPQQPQPLLSDYRGSFFLSASED